MKVRLTANSYVSGITEPDGGHLQDMHDAVGGDVTLTSDPVKTVS